MFEDKIIHYKPTNFSNNNNNIVGSVATILGGNFEAIYNGGFVIGQFPPTMLMNMNMQQAKHGVMQHQPQMMYHM